MDKQEKIKQLAMEEVESMEVVYMDVESEFQELKDLLSDLEDSIVILPLLGLNQEYSAIMKDKMAMYEAQIAAFRALYSYLHQKVIAPNDGRLITRRGTKNLNEE